MIKYAKIENQETKACSVGIGTNSAFYESIGMTQMDVEQAWNGNWYVTGYAPSKPQEVINQERIAELKQQLAETDADVLALAENALLNGGNLVMTADAQEECSTLLSNRAAWRAELEQLTTN